MTTVAYKDGMLAADSRSCIGGGGSHMIYEEDAVKLFPHVGPFLAVGISGDQQVAEDIIMEVSRYTTVDQVRGFELSEEAMGVQMLAIDHEGQLWYYQGSKSFKLRSDKPYAIGSGSDFALAAMDLGKTAEEAVSFAATRDPFTNTEVQKLEITFDEQGDDTREA
jgi:hypothetical protein